MALSQRFAALKQCSFNKILVVNKNTSFNQYEEKEMKMSPYNERIFRKKM